MNTALWIVTGILAAVYLASGVGKLILSKERIAAIGRPTRWVEDFSQGAVRAIAVAEILAAIGLVLPALLGVATVFVPLAALGLALLMGGATVVRIRRGEGAAALLDVVYLALAAFVAVGRFGLAPLSA